MNAFEQGYQDFGKGQTTNPYNPNTPKYRDWEFGFNKAFFRNLERITPDQVCRGGQAVQG